MASIPAVVIVTFRIPPFYPPGTGFCPWVKAGAREKRARLLPREEDLVRVP
jgi:hypothetical protein